MVRFAVKCRRVAPSCWSLQGMSGGEAAPHLLPEDGADLVADQAVQDAPRLLRLVALLIERARVLDRLLHGALGDLVEGDALGAVGEALAELFFDVPGDGLAFAVGV